MTPGHCVEINGFLEVSYEFGCASFHVRCMKWGLGNNLLVLRFGGKSGYLSIVVLFYISYYFWIQRGIFKNVHTKMSYNISGGYINRNYSVDRRTNGRKNPMYKLFSTFLEFDRTRKNFVSFLKLEIFIIPYLQHPNYAERKKNERRSI